MNENNLAMEEVPSSDEDKPSPSQPMDGADYDTDALFEWFISQQHKKMLLKNLGYQFSIWASDRKCLLAQTFFFGQSSTVQHCWFILFGLQADEIFPNGTKDWFLVSLL